MNLNFPLDILIAGNFLEDIQIPEVALRGEEEESSSNEERNRPTMTANDSSSDDDEEEEEEEETDRVVVLEMYTALYKDLDKIREQINDTREVFDNRKGDYYASNFDRTKKRPIPIKMVIERYEKLVPMLARLEAQVTRVKRQIRAMDRHDTEIFYPLNYRMFKEKTYPTFIQPAREIPLPRNANPSICTCCSEPANMAIHRSCIWCEGHQCSCKEFSLCEKCAPKWYWRNSESFTKSFATCPMCRAEYCLEDIVIYHFGNEEDHLSIQEQINLQKRKLSELEAQLSPFVEEEAKRLKMSDIQEDLQM